MSEEVKVVQSVYDAINDVTANIATGTIERINIKRINADGSARETSFKDKTTGQTKVIKSTHNYSLLLKEGEDTAWISFGQGEVKNLKYENQFQIKTDDGYVDLKEGMKIRLPVVLKKYKRAKDGVEATSVEGKKNRIKITDASGAREPRSQAPQSTQTASNTSGGATTKVYGDIVTVSESDVVVKTETGEVTVKLSAEQLAQIVEGGRIAGQRAADGTLSAFKAYGPKGQGGSTSGGSKGSFKKDNSGMETGHALNGALNLRRAGLTIPPVAEVAKVVHDVTKHLKQDAAQAPENKGMSDYDIGAMVGHAVLNATRDVQVGENDNPEEITQKLLDYSRELMATVVPAVSAYVKGENLQEAAKATPEPELKPTVEDAPHINDNGHIDMTPEDVDFDLDIPF